MQKMRLGYILNARGVATPLNPNFQRQIQLKKKELALKKIERGKRIAEKIKKEKRIDTIKKLLKLGCLIIALLGIAYIW